MDHALPVVREASARKGHSLSVPSAHLDLLMTDRSVAEALAHCASMFGLSPETVVTIVQVGLPQMARMAELSPELLKRIHAASLAPMPESLPDFYVRMSQDRALRQAIMDDYKA